MITQGYLVIVYALFLLIGGLIGYFKAHSLPSLISGSLSATLLIASGIAMLKGMKLGFIGAVALTAILLLFFIYRFSLTMNFFPAGFTALLSLIVLLGLLIIKR